MSSSSSSQSSKNLGQTIKYKCMGLKGQERADCVRTTATERKRVVRRAISTSESRCGQFEIRTTDYRTCMRNQSEKMKDAMRREKITPRQHRMNRTTRSAAEQKGRERGMMIRTKLMKRMHRSSSAGSSVSSGS